VFVIFIVAPVVVILAIVVEGVFHPEPWMHLVLWLPTVVLLSLILLRPFKGVLIALQYQRHAGEGRPG
jgi:uncharacterized protein (DUF983 family)